MIDGILSGNMKPGSKITRSVAQGGEGADSCVLSGCILHRVIITLRRMRRTTHVARMG